MHRRHDITTATWIAWVAAVSLLATGAVLNSLPETALHRSQVRRPGRPTGLRPAPRRRARTGYSGSLSPLRSVQRPCARSPPSGPESFTAMSATRTVGETHQRLLSCSCLPGR